MHPLWRLRGGVPDPLSGVVEIRMAHAADGLRLVRRVRGGVPGGGDWNGGNV